MKNSEIKIIRTSTIPLSLDLLLKGQLKYLNKFYHILAVSGSGINLENVKTREGIEVIQVEMQREISLYKDLISLYQMYKTLRKEKPHIVHSITPKAGLISMVAAKLAGVPIRIHTFTGLIFPSRKGIFKNLLIAMDKVLCSCATTIFPEGKGVQKDLEQYQITSKPLKIIANGNVNGVDIGYYNSENITDQVKLSLKESLKIREDDFVFIFVGRLVKDKGINELIAAFDQLEKSNSKLLLVGPFENNNDPISQNTILTIEKNPNIIAVGWQSDTRLYMSIANVLVLPSYREGFPNVVLEAGAMGLPSIVTDINGSNEIITHNFNGFIVPKKNITELKSAMLEISKNKILYESFRKNCRSNIEKKYQQIIVWESLRKEYDSLIENYLQ